MNVRTLGFCACVSLILGTTAAPLPAAIVKATYRFANTLAADEPGVPALLATDPLNANHFELQPVFGQMRTVYVTDGAESPPALQAGLTLPTAGLLPVDNYSVELVFEFLERQNAWRRIIDVQDRATDNGFYVDPGNRLDVYPVAGSLDSFQLNVFYHVVLVNDHQNVRAYLNGIREVTIATNVMDIANAASLLHLFLDNNGGPAQNEFSDARIALARFYEGALTDAEVTALATDPFGNTCHPARGDVNADGVVSGDDAAGMVAVLLGNDIDADHRARADMNCDGQNDGDDIQPFVTRLLGP